MDTRRILREWEDFSSTFPKDLDDQSREALRKVFYSGATSAFKLLQKALIDPDPFRVSSVFADLHVELMLIDEHTFHVCRERGSVKHHG